MDFHEHECVRTGRKRTFGIEKISDCPVCFPEPECTVLEYRNFPRYSYRQEFTAENGGFEEAMRLSELSDFPCEIWIPYHFDMGKAFPYGFCIAVNSAWQKEIREIPEPAPGRLYDDTNSDIPPLY